MPRTILIQGPDGQTKTLPLSGSRMAVGRSSGAELSFPDDAGLSRQHFALEPAGEDWTVQDLGSKNGTFVNAIPLKAKLILRPGDRITAGHLSIVFAPESRASAPGVVVFEGGDDSRRIRPALRRWSPAWETPTAPSWSSRAAAPNPRRPCRR